MTFLKPINGDKLEYSHIVGTGGMGSGIFFKLHGNHTLGRNESRLGELIPLKDYCKMHIIMHYVAVLLGANQRGSFEAFPIGKVGSDSTGRSLIEEMQKVGICTDNITLEDGTSTLFSICFQYPDNTGGNITTANSACSRMTPEDIDSFFDKFTMEGKDELILAVPEVSIDTRLRLLEKGRERGSFNAASILSSEVDEFKSRGGFDKVDLLSVNIDEAKAIAGLEGESYKSEQVVDGCVNTLIRLNPHIMLTITDGPCGSYGYKDNYVEYTPIFETDVASTAGAGDTFLAGTLSGLCCGLPFLKGRSDKYFSETPLKSAVELGTMLAGLAVAFPDTIHQKADVKLLWKIGEDKKVRYSPEFLKLFY